MIGRNNPQKILEEIVKLDTVEFLGVCTILGVDIYEVEKKEQLKEDGEEKNDEGAPSTDDPKKMELKPRNFTDIWCDLCDKVWSMNRRRRKNLAKLIRTATKKEN